MVIKSHNYLDVHSLIKSKHLLKGTPMGANGSLWMVVCVCECVRICMCVECREIGEGREESDS